MTRPCVCCDRRWATNQGLVRHEQTVDEPYFCTCATSDFDAIDQCRRCLRADARAPRVAAAIARVAARRQEVA